MIPKGTGNSRFLKSAIDENATWESARSMLRNGTFPFDLNGTNQEGLHQQGTPLNEATLLTESTAALMGLDRNATPNSMAAAIATKLNGLIVASTTDLTDGVSPLPTGVLYVVYEE